MSSHYMLNIYFATRVCGSGVCEDELSRCSTGWTIGIWITSWFTWAKISMQEVTYKANTCWWVKLKAILIYPNKIDVYSNKIPWYNFCWTRSYHNVGAIGSNTHFRRRLSTCGVVQWCQHGMKLWFCNEINFFWLFRVVNVLLYYGRGRGWIRLVKSLRWRPLFYHKYIGGRSLMKNV